MTKQKMLSFEDGMIGPPKDLLLITPSDTNDLTTPIQGVYNGDAAAGNIAVITLMGTTITIPNIPSGALFEGCFTRVLATGTTVSVIIGTI